MGDESTTPDDLVNRPQVDCEGAIKLAEKLWGFKIDIRSVKEFVGYDDKNFFLKAEPPQKDVKISENEEPCVVRILTFLPGKTLYEVSPWTPELFYQAGQFIARMDEAWIDFHHPVFAQRKYIWYLKDVLMVREYLYAVEDTDQREMCAQVLDDFEAKVVSQMDKLERGMIHGDYNEQNMLVRPKEGVSSCSSDGRDYFVSGVIDFGDSIESPYIFEVGVTIMYTMLKCNEIDKNEVGGHVIAGYKRVKGDFSPLELEVLPIAVAARFVQSLVLGAYYYLEDPTNEYVLVTAHSGGWKALTNFWSTPREDLFQLWSKIDESYNKC